MADYVRGSLKMEGALRNQSAAKSPKVAFLIPMYQSRATIAACLNSVIRQSFRDFEAIIVDDCSTDGSAEIVSAFARTDARLRLVRMSQRSGIANALNAGLRETNAEFIARLDTDDEAMPERLGQQLQMLTASPKVAVCGSYVTYMGASAERDQIGKVPVENSEIQLMLRGTYDCPFFHPSVTFRRNVVLHVGGYRPFFRNSEDCDLWLRLSNNHEFHNIPQPLTRFRFNVSGISISDLWGQRLYAILAKSSWQSPDASLDELWSAITAKQDATDKYKFLSYYYRYLYKKLHALGWKRQALSLLPRAARDVGIGYAMLLPIRTKVPDMQPKRKRRATC